MRNRKTIEDNTPTFLIKRIVFRISLAVIILLICKQSNSQHLSEILMNSTFQIDNGFIRGTAFIVGRQSSKIDTIFNFVLITAKHILQHMNTDEAIIKLRYANADSTYSNYIYTFYLKYNGRQLWVSHSDSSIDVAAMYLPLPIKIDFHPLPTTFFANDSIIKDIELKPGDELFSLGFPYGIAANQYNFPILRSGHLSSYPLLPSTLYNTYLLDIEVFDGMSGGPVFISDLVRPLKKDVYHSRFDYLIGLLSSKKTVSIPFQTITETGHKTVSLQLATIIPARYILETINQLEEDPVEYYKDFLK